MMQPLIAAVMGVSLRMVNRAHMAYDQGGNEALKPRPSGGRKRENMTLKEEKALLASFAKAAGAGEMLNIHDLKAAYKYCDAVTSLHATYRSSSSYTLECAFTLAMWPMPPTHGAPA